VETNGLVDVSVRCFQAHTEPSGLPLAFASALP
jgi:hypothetical protein